MEIDIEGEISLKINSMLSENIRFALYRLPQESEPILVVQEAGESYCFSSSLELTEVKGFLIAPFSASLEYPIVLIRPDKVLSGTTDIASYLKKYPDLLTPDIHDKATESFPDESFVSYNDTYNVFMDALETGVFKKLVLSRSSTVKAPSDLSLYKTFQKLALGHPDEFIFLCHTPESGTWMGCTPERMLTKAGEQWQTVALAGTRKEDSEAGWDEKNKHEQLIVTEYLEEQLLSLGIAAKKGEVETIQAGHLLHLETVLTFDLPPTVSVGKLLDRLHPTPAVSGFPKKEAFRFIMHNELNDRRYYSGYLGCIDIKGSTDLYVNLRCMQLAHGQLRFHAGGGLLTTSEMLSEWEETEAKMDTLRSVIL